MCSVGGPAPGRAMEVEVHSDWGLPTGKTKFFYIRTDTFLCLEPYLRFVLYFLRGSALNEGITDTV